jgi:acyl carrier protein phosphodiesterase
VNYLAHCFLAEATPESLIGSLAPDFNRAGAYEPTHPAIRTAMTEHLAIDTFTDAHPATAAVRSLYEKQFRHLGGVLADVTYDHFLAIHWPRFHSVELSAYTETIYRTLDEHRLRCPVLLQDCLPRMREQNWLASYRTLEGVAETLRRMSQRLSRKPSMEDAVMILEDHYDELEQKFEMFFPELQRFVQDLRRRAQ